MFKVSQKSAQKEVQQKTVNRIQLTAIRLAKAISKFY